MIENAIETKVEHMHLKQSPITVLCVRPGLIEMHGRFRNPAIGKFCALIKRARPYQADKKPRNLIKHISVSCKAFKVFVALLQGSW